MKLACVTVTYNDFQNLDSWKDYFQIYREEIDLHIIVDNASTKEYKSILFDKFSDSTIIELEQNGGVTKGFNEGIKLALKNPEISFILLACPDIKYTSGSLTMLKNTLIENPNIGIIGPIIYNSQNQIEVAGARLSKYLAPRFYLQKDVDSFPNIFEVDFVSGGINMISRTVYEKIGLQDESLFMYGDEVDFDIRAKNAGFKLMIQKNTSCFHLHIFKNNDTVRSSLSYFLFSRNTYLLYRKHLKILQRLSGYLRLYYYSFYTILELLKTRKYDRIKAYLVGIIYGQLYISKIPLKYLKK